MINNQKAFITGVAATMLLTVGWQVSRQQAGGSVEKADCMASG
jgi:hypothetical protein